MALSSLFLMATSRRRKRRKPASGARPQATPSPAATAPREAPAECRRAVAAADEPAAGGPGAWRVILILVVGLVTYSNSFTGPFIFDDVPAIAESEAVRAWPDLPAAIAAEPESPLASRPAVSLTFALNYAVHALDVRGYHAVNLALHLACALLVFGVVRRTLAAGVPGAGGLAASGANVALATALVWLVHPLNSEVVNYLTQRTESMMAACYLLTLYCGIRALDDERPGLWHALGVAACAVGMASKESMVTAPLVVLLYDRVFVFGSFREAIRGRGRFYAGLLATLVVLALSMWSSPRTMSTGFATANASVWVYLLNQTVMITRYLRLAIWPDALVLYYGWSLPVTLGEVFPYAFFVVALLAVTTVALVRRPVLGFVGAWFFITLAPASSVIAIASEVGAERRMYLPMVGLVSLVVVGGAWLIDRLRDRGAWHPPAWTPALAVAALCVALGARTYARTAEYESSLAMAETVLARWPTDIGRHMVGTELLNAGRSEEALPLLADAIDTYATAYFNYGTALFNVGRLEEAEAALRTFLRLEPGSSLVPRARATLGRTLARQGRLDEAIAVLEGAVVATPGDVEARGLLADAYFQTRQFARAIPLYRDFLDANPGHAGAEANLAAALAATGATDEALDRFRRAVEAAPANPDARLNLAAALIEAGDLDEAAVHAAEAVALNPTFVPARDLYGRILAGQGKIPEAIAQFERALEIDPTFAPAREALRIIRGGG